MNPWLIGGLAYAAALYVIWAIIYGGAEGQDDHE